MLETKEQKDLEKRSPASFLLVNSRGRPDFVMTMLVVVIVALLIVVLFWMGLNVMTMLHYASGSEESNQLTELMKNFNEQAQIIILGLCSSVFTLAGTYFLRRSSYDKHYLERESSKAESMFRLLGEGAITEGASGISAGFVKNTETTLHHPNYDDEEEDI